MKCRTAAARRRRQRRGRPVLANALRILVDHQRFEEAARRIRELIARKFAEGFGCPPQGGSENAR